MGSWTDTSILLVDDSELIRSRLKGLLRENDFGGNIYEAVNARHALNMFTRYSPEIVMMEITLCGENSIHLIRKIKILNPGVRILVLTANYHEYYRKGSLTLGAEFFFSKHFEVNAAIKFCKCLYDDLRQKPERQFTGIQRVRIL